MKYIHPNSLTCAAACRDAINFFLLSTAICGAHSSSGAYVYLFDRPRCDKRQRRKKVSILPSVSFPAKAPEKVFFFRAFVGILRSVDSSSSSYGNLLAINHGSSPFSILSSAKNPSLLSPPLFHAWLSFRSIVHHATNRSTYGRILLLFPHKNKCLFSLLPPLHANDVLSPCGPIYPLPPLCGRPPSPYPPPILSSIQ